MTRLELFFLCLRKNVAWLCCGEMNCGSVAVYMIEKQRSIGYGMTSTCRWSEDWGLALKLTCVYSPR